MPAPLRLAMWSGPRNVSTALMRSFGSRPDTIVCDEPLYAHYLRVTGLDHPIAAEVVERHESDWRRAVAMLLGPLPPGRTIFYQKHMAHHLLPGIERGWLAELRHAFLIRDPREMLASLLEILPEPRLEDTGLPQQLRLFRELRGRGGAAPPVVDSKDLLQDPAGLLAALCEGVGIDFDRAMLRWEPGPRDTDGCWAPHWYGNALESTGFAPWKPKDAPIPARFDDLLARCEEAYAEMHAERLAAR